MDRMMTEEVAPPQEWFNPTETSGVYDVAGNFFALTTLGNKGTGGKGFGCIDWGGKGYGKDFGGNGHG